MTNISGDEQQVSWIFHINVPFLLCVCYAFCLPNTI